MYVYNAVSSEQQYLFNTREHYDLCNAYSTYFLTRQYGHTTVPLENEEEDDHTTIPTLPTPIRLSTYEYGKMPSGKLLVTAGNQTIEFFLDTVNIPAECLEHN